MIFRLILTAAAVFVVSANPLQRLKRATQCRVENQFVGGTASDDYHMDIETEKACIEICKGMDNCTAINYFTKHNACLPQVENTNEDKSLEFREEEGVLYVVVKGCDDSDTKPEEPEPQEPARRKRDVDANCKLDDILVGGSPVTEKGYIDHSVPTLNECIEECQKMDECNAVNYWAEFGDCLPQRETLASEDKDRLSSREEPGATYVVVKNCNIKIEKPANILPPVPTEEPEEPQQPEEPQEPQEPEEPQEAARRKRDVDANCKLDDVLVGGSPITEKGYVERSVPTLEECIEECKKMDECNAVNYWAEYGDCLPQRETLASEDKDGLSSREEPGTTYVVVKNCNGKIEKPANILPPVTGNESEESEESKEEQEVTDQRKWHSVNGRPGRRRRSVQVDDNCKLDDVLVGGSIVTEKGYVEGSVTSLEACIEECQKLEECNAVNYFPKNEACLPQRETLASEDKDRLASREEPGTTYYVVKNCNGKIEKPANILPPATNEESDNSEEGTGETSDSSEGTSEEKETEETEKDVDTGNLGDPNPSLPSEEDPYIPQVQRGRKKRDAVQCRQEKKLVGGEIVGEVLMDVTDEDKCVAACKNSEKCQAVNYFPEPHFVCWLQARSLVTDPDLQTREDDLTNYIIVKGCESS